MWFLLSFVIGLFATMLLLPPLIVGAERLGFLDLPNARKVHSIGIPRTGGLAMVGGIFLATVLCQGASQSTWVLLAATMIIAAFGAWDDRANLDFRMKFLGQTIAALLVIFYGDVLIERIAFWSDEPLPRLVSIPLTLFALLGVTNAVNLSDGLDGLAGGLMLLSFSAIALLAHISGANDLVIIALAVMGSILGFLRFNTHPARVFMGDAGSQSLGFVAAVLAILITQRVNPAVSSVVPLFLVGLPLLDTALVAIRRIRERRSPFSPDLNHIHHRLLRHGFLGYEAVAIIYFAHAGLVTAGYFLRQHSDELLLLVFVGFSALVIAGFMWAARAGWSFRESSFIELARPVSLGRTPWFRESPRVTRALLTYVSIAVLAYPLLGIFSSNGVTREMGVIALILLVVLIAMYIRRRGAPFHLVERAGLYVACAYAGYLLDSASPALGWLRVFDKAFFLSLAAAVLLAVVRCRGERFRLTPLDLLVVFMALMVPFMPSDYFQPFDNRLLMKIVVLFYGVEVLLYNFDRKPDAMRFATMAGCFALCLRGLF